MIFLVVTSVLAFLILGFCNTLTWMQIAILVYLWGLLNIILIPFYS